jgi:hypothetical protein
MENVLYAFKTTVVPMLNPLNYSLMNNDVTHALKKILDRKPCSSTELVYFHAETRL